MCNEQNIVQLETERLLLQELTLNDITDLHCKNSIKEVAEFNTIGIPENIEKTAEFYRPIIADRSNKDRLKYTWIIRLKGTNVFIGEIGLNLAPKRFRMGEIHYSLLPKYWGNGYARESIKKIITCSFDELMLHRLEAGVATENLRSIKLLEGLGMTNEGVRRKILPIRGEWRDNCHYAILEDDQRNY